MLKGIREPERGKICKNGSQAHKMMERRRRNNNGESHQCETDCEKNAQRISKQKW